MSDTPRTDAAEKDVQVAYIGMDGLSSCPEKFVEPEFARDLERENNRLRELIGHAWLHSAYKNCGYRQMTTEQKALYDAVVDAYKKDIE